MKPGFALGLVAVGLVGMMFSTASVDRPGWGRMPMMSPMHGSTGSSSAAAPVDGAAIVEIVGREMEFSPARLEIPAGEVTNIEFRNTGVVVHDLTIEQSGFVLVAGPGETVAGSFLAPASGSLTFFCSVPGHRAAGMVGTIEVTP